MTDWIQGDKFIGLADYTFSPKKRAGDDYDGLVNTLNKNDRVWQDMSIKARPIIYTHGMYADDLFSHMWNIHRHFIVILHNSDNALTSDKEWGSHMTNLYSTNVNYNEQLFIQSIPIGLENDRWFRGLHKKEKMLAMVSQPRTYKNMVYMNHNVKTNPAERTKPYEVLERMPWVTVERGSNGHGFDEYLHDIYSHNFVICPAGNGMDTHRTWETLYMGSIPIEKRNINNQFYTELPICFVDDWEEVTVDFLESEYSRIKRGAWNMEMLNFSYWKNKIQNVR